MEFCGLSKVHSQCMSHYFTMIEHAFCTNYEDVNFKFMEEDMTATALLD